MVTPAGAKSCDMTGQMAYGQRGRAKAVRLPTRHNGAASAAGSRSSRSGKSFVLKYAAMRRLRQHAGRARYNLTLYQSCRDGCETAGRKVSY